ncbi:FAD:protein FMN transferase [Flagellimonas taeanensis]|uniref:FAD:protein FMN transferase n=1 Tax=Flagellimonas taeanensis TaxID=1005926 RepID=A0A1M6UMV4_9FLAO|nr:MULTISPECIES: FAD:protein FMN transferase [Allomuricauda]MDC6385867.1 FAD:protein FMN transferase [Muricauda sp. SK9]MEE1964255.1 FAD:protein FMN transferase [Allomuricauda taeanensis]RIV50844.1 FAD:protein FMN transferase [Allomuricauda taeanensis]SFC54711.1 thiamine biosynthesis lipoprotein [Allomuricauda taeanensis]SHK70489.1 thiamine biosynthesis lipoprotein [Allomuricauda taeanensis]
MKAVVLLLSSLSCLLSLGQLGQKDVTVKKTLKLMGTRFEVTVVAPNEEIGYINIDEAVSEIQRIEKIISSWDENSETSLINKNAGIKPVKVSPELFGLIERSIRISEITDGAFDITYASMDNIWKFDGSMETAPKEEDIRKAVEKIGYQKIVMDPKNQTVFLPEPGMCIGFGAIGKGYAADKAKELMVSKDVKGGIINASGDLTTWGTKVTGEKWLVGIANPLSKDKVFSWLPVIESSVATSGNYEKFIILNGKKYSHIIDPRTGYPTTGINSVSIFAKQAELCDALATAVFIMGRDVGLHMINQMDGVEAVVVDSDNKIHKSSGIIFDMNP